MVARSARYAGLGSRSCCTLSLNTRLPNVSAALAPVDDGVRSASDQSRMPLMASERAADPIGRLSFLVSGCGGAGPRGRERGQPIMHDRKRSLQYSAAVFQ